MVGEVGDSQIVGNLPVTNVPACTGSSAKTLGLQHLQFLDMGASGGLPDGTRIIHHGTDELLIRQHTIPDGETASPVQERSQRSQSLHRLSNLHTSNTLSTRGKEGEKRGRGERNSNLGKKDRRI
jgi:hypothetical protein